jgi:hypothetical protein
VAAVEPPRGTPIPKPSSCGCSSTCGHAAQKRDVELAPIKASRNTFQDDTRPKTGARSQTRALGDKRARARAQRSLTHARTHTRTHTGARTFLRAWNRRTNARTNACSNLRGGRKARARTHSGAADGRRGQRVRQDRVPGRNTVASSRLGSVQLR